MISQKELKQKALRKYKSFLSSKMSGDDFFPLIIPSDKKLNDDFEKMSSEIKNLLLNSNENKINSYSVVRELRKTQKHGLQSIPTKIQFNNELDFLNYIGKKTEAKTIINTYQTLLGIYPELKTWMIQKPLSLLEIANELNFFVETLGYFKNNPTPNLYIRELPIKVDTKFVERNKGILKGLLEVITGSSLNKDENVFEKRFNLKSIEPQVRLRQLDEKLDRNIFSCSPDIMIPISSFESLNPVCKNVFIVENKMNFLVFPPVKDSLVIFGEGNAVNIQKNTPWLKNKSIYYSGDIDTWGLQILSSYRSHFPKTVSLLMTKELFDKYCDNFAVEEKVSVSECPNNLTHNEKELFLYLNSLPKKQSRLEQERIPYSELETFLKTIMNAI